MSSTDRSLPGMPVPSFAYPDRHDGRVFVRRRSVSGKLSKRTIGYLTDSTPGEEKMVPNRYFRELYPDLFSEAYPGKPLPEREISAGMYALTLGIATETGLYEDLRNIYGAEDVNAILDFAMFSILHPGSSPQEFEKAMEREAVFSGRLRSGSWYSAFFTKRISEDQNHALRIRRMEHLTAAGLRKVWLSAGAPGSGSGAAARCIYALDAATGRPATYFPCSGSVPDSQSFEKIYVFLRSFHVEIEGAVLDSRFALPEVLSLVRDRGLKYVIALPGDCPAHLQMLKEHAADIRWRSGCLLEDGDVSGTAAAIKPFSESLAESPACLFFDGEAAFRESLDLIRKVQSEKRRIQRAIASGEEASVPRDLRKYLSISGEGTERTLRMDSAALDGSMSSMGFFSMAVSDGISPSDALRLCRMPEASGLGIPVGEEGGSGLGIPVGEEGGSGQAGRAACSPGRLAMLFISGIVRSEFMQACRKYGLSEAQALRSLSEVRLLSSGNDQYEAVRGVPDDALRLLGEFSIDADSLERIAAEYSSRSRADERNPDRRLPDDGRPLTRSNSHRRGRPPKAAPEKSENGGVSGGDAPETVKSKGGRPKGKKDSKPRKPRSDRGVPRKKGMPLTKHSQFL